MSDLARKRVQSHSRQKSGSLLCLLLLAEHARDNGEGIITKDLPTFTQQLAHNCRMTLKRTRDILAELIEAGELRRLEHEDGRTEFQIIFPKTRYTAQTAQAERQKRASSKAPHVKKAPARSEKKFPETGEKISGKNFPEVPEKISTREKPKKQSGTLEIFSSEVFSSINMNINNKNNLLVGREGEQEQPTHLPPAPSVPEEKPKTTPAEQASKPTHDTRLKFFEKLMGFQKAHHHFQHLERWDEQYSREFISLAWRLAPLHKHPRFAHRAPEFLFIDWLNRHKDCPWPDQLLSQYQKDVLAAHPELAETKPENKKADPVLEFTVGNTYLWNGKEVKLDDISPTTPWATLVDNNGEFHEVYKHQLPSLLQPCGGAM